MRRLVVGVTLMVLAVTGCAVSSNTQHLAGPPQKGDSAPGDTSPAPSGGGALFGFGAGGGPGLQGGSAPGEPGGASSTDTLPGGRADAPGAGQQPGGGSGTGESGSTSPVGPDADLCRQVVTVLQSTFSGMGDVNPGSGGVPDFGPLQTKLRQAAQTFADLAKKAPPDLATHLLTVSAELKSAGDNPASLQAATGQIGNDMAPLLKQCYPGAGGSTP